MMDQLPASLVNAFAIGIAGAFGRAAKGLDAASQCFVRARPSEKILTGFLTPSRGPVDHVDVAEAEPAHEAPDLPPDEPFEQSSIGFEWCVPASELPTLRLNVRVGFSVYIRTLPSYATASANAFFDRAGQARIVEEWKRLAVADSDDRPLTCEITPDLLLQDQAVRIPLAAEGVRGAVMAAVDESGYRPFKGSQEIDLTAADFGDERSYEAKLVQLLGSRSPTFADWKPAIDCRIVPAPSEPGCVRVMLRLVNGSEVVPRQAAAFRDPRLYAVSLVASLPVGAHRDTQFRSLPSSYRYDRSVKAVGINCQAHVTISGGSLQIRSDTVPIARGPRIVPREVAGGQPQFAVLAQADCGTAVLDTIRQAMLDYDATNWASKLADLIDPDEQEDAARDRETFRGEIRAFTEGIALLKDPTNERERYAFQLMNETMHRLGKARSKPYDKWHLFQIVFIVSTLPDLVRSGLSLTSERRLNLLWFPAGGGKTEAFLGLIVWQAFYDRLRGKAFGITAFLRYPLRLLTYQQLQRLSLALGCADALRREKRISGASFSLGYFVGETTTPNSIGTEKHNQLVKSGVPADYQRVFKCPRCLNKTVALRYNGELRLIEHYCSSNTCPTQGARLPIYIVDDDLYRYLPTVIVSTVDKLAGLGQQRRFAQLFGRIEFVCPEHGAAFAGSNRGLCTASDLRLRGERPERCGAAKLLWGPFDHLAPSLHIQDELHLLRESLATFDSHYETTATTMQGDFGSPEWTLVGSTATIAGYEQQARQLYQAKARRFPGPGPEAYDSFYYNQDSPFLGRIYVGLLGVGRSHTPSVARALALLYGLIERVRVEAPADPKAVCDLLSLPPATVDQLTALAFFYEVVLTYVLTRKGGDQVSEAIDSRVKAAIEQFGSAALRIESFHSNVDMPRMISTMEEIEGAKPDIAVSERVRGVVATNIISHGVDIDRFNIMVFAGFPKQVAEYIQASARVGRQWPGLSVLVITPQAERDRSVLHRFDKFHQYVDRLVEPVPIQRWSEPALDLTVRGLIAAYLMGVVPRLTGRELYMVKHVYEQFGRPGMESLEEDAVCDWVLRALGTDAPDAPAGFAGIARKLTARHYGRLHGASPNLHNQRLSALLEAMTSLRDVDDPAWIRLSKDGAAELARLGL